MTDPKKPARWPLVSLLVFCGGISVTLSEVHAYDKMQAGTVADGLVAFLVGIAPVVAAALLAELLANSAVAGWLKTGVGVVFVGAMTLSVDAQAETVKPIVGEDLAVIFPLVLDLSTIVALLALAGVGLKQPAAAETVEQPPARPVAEAPADRSPTGVEIPRSVVDWSPVGGVPPARPVAEPRPVAPAAPTRPVADRSPIEPTPAPRPVAELPTRPVADRSPVEPAPAPRPVDRPRPTGEPTAPRPVDRPRPTPVPAAPKAQEGTRRVLPDSLLQALPDNRSRVKALLAEDMTLSGADIGRIITAAGFQLSPERGRALRREVLPELEAEQKAGERPVILRAVAE